MQETRAHILETLSDGAVSGPALAERLGMSRAAVWKHVESLREAGFEIGSTSSGYVLESVPEYGSEAVEWGLEAPFEIEYHERIESTNQRARELAGTGHNNVVVLADTQTGGRGRLDREWVSPSGGIWLSILIRPAVPATHAPLYTLAGAVATARAVSELDVNARIKWPNDVLIDGKKVAGVLTEMEGEADRISWLIVGIGINANVDPEVLPDDRDITTLEAEVGPVIRRTLTQTLLSEFYELRTRPGTILSAWRERSATLNKRVRIATPTGDVVGEAVDIESPGALVVETTSGREHVTVGDCEHLRPTDG